MELLLLLNTYRRIIKHLLPTDGFTCLDNKISIVLFRLKLICCYIY